MASTADNPGKGTGAGSAPGVQAPGTASSAAAGSRPASGEAGNAAALAVCERGPEETPPEEAEDTRLDALPMQVDVMVKVHSLRVRDLLAMERGTVVETIHEHTQDVPLRCGGALLLWSEFEVLDQRLAVRVTRLA